MTAPLEQPRRLLVLGSASSGKTTYRTQLYQRIEHQRGELELIKSVDDLRGMENDIERLVRGLQPMHTHLDTYEATSFSVRNRAGRALSLEFADYGGEQILRIAQSNVVPDTWIERARQTESWLFLLRIDPVRPDQSFMTTPVEAEHTPPPTAESPDNLSSPELDAIETIQRLLFARGATLREPLVSPRLGLLLSCWDELPSDERSLTPLRVLQNRAPLLEQFLTNNWDSDELTVWGLSSTERRLPETDPDAEFARKGAEHFGYLVSPDGRQTKDLTLPIGWLMS